MKPAHEEQNEKNTSFPASPKRKMKVLRKTKGGGTHHGKGKGGSRVGREPREGRNSQGRTKQQLQKTNHATSMTKNMPTLMMPKKMTTLMMPTLKGMTVTTAMINDARPGNAWSPWSGRGRRPEGKLGQAMRGLCGRVRGL